jgi:hypothetical protein
LLELWREKHQDAVEQLGFAFSTDDKCRFYFTFLRSNRVDNGQL